MLKALIGMYVPETLERIRDLLDAGWCQNTMAKSRVGIPVNAHDPRATRFCLVGAIAKAQRDGAIKDTVTDLLRSEMQRSDPKQRSLVHWNDASARSKEEVLHLVNRVIANVING